METEGMLQCPQMKQMIYDYLCNDGKTRSTVLEDTLVDKEWCDSFLTAVGGNGCVYKANCEIYKKFLVDGGASNPNA